MNKGIRKHKFHCDFCSKSLIAKNLSIERKIDKKHLLLCQSCLSIWVFSISDLNIRHLTKYLDVI